jgi:hypothetical protein
MADEVIGEVRRVRHEISRRCGHDVHKVVAWYRAFQEELKQSGKYRFLHREDAPWRGSRPVEDSEQKP